MKSWKNQLENTININSMLEQYERITTALQTENKELARRVRIMHSVLEDTHTHLTEQPPTKTNESIAQLIHTRLERALDKSKDIAIT
jgi:hypothetical protein